ncbi:MAG: hypothetical protein ACI392_05445 [Paludibacteraceae bacterium]
MKTDTWIKISFGILSSVLVAICTFFIVYNASWVLGDDTQLILHTGWHRPIFGYIEPPSIGRFFPLNYTLYNVLLLFYDAQIPPVAHYTINAIGFVVFCAFFVGISLRLSCRLPTMDKYFLSFLTLLIVVGRTIDNFQQCWTGVWTIFVFIPIFVYGYIKYKDNNNIAWLIVSLLAINYILYYYETMFSIPLIIGLAGLVFGRSFMDKVEKMYHYLLIGSGLLFLLLYCILVLPKIEAAYSHNSTDSLLVNAIKMLYAQKIMWLVLGLLVWRVFLFIRKSANYTFYDSLLLGSCAYFCASAILKLEWTLYYIPSVLLAFPAIIYFILQLPSKWFAYVSLILLSVLYAPKIPKSIRSNQRGRIYTMQEVVKYLELTKKYPAAYFYMPLDDSLSNYDRGLRGTRRLYIESLIAWYLNDPQYKVLKIYDDQSFVTGVWIMQEGDECAFLNNSVSLETNIVKTNIFKLSTLRIYIIE